MAGRTTYDFSGQSAIVTGSTKGIGRGIAEALAEAGANVLVNSRTETDVELTVADLDADASGTIRGQAADVAEPDDIDRLVAAAVEAFGTVDLLVNNAAVWPEEPSMVEATLADWDHTMNVNVRSQFYATKRVAEHMIDAGVAGSVVNVTSQAGDRRSGGRGLYGVSNSAINGLTWRLAHDLAEHDIRVNAVSTATTESRQLLREAEVIAADDPDRTGEQVMREWGEQRPLRRLGQPSDLAGAVLFLASDRAEYVIGDILRVSGGGNLE